MSSNPLAKDSGEDAFLGADAAYGQDRGSSDMETPRSEAPPSVNVMTPRTTEAATMQSADGAVNDYFTTQPAANEQQQQQQQRPRSPRAPIGPGITSRTSAKDLNELSLLHAQAQLSPRPTPQHTPSSLSIESTDSAATVRPTPPALQSLGPTYPDQTFAALHNQYHGAYHRPPSYLRGPSAYSPVANFATAIASHHQSGARSATNSPAVTPNFGLFSNAGPPSAPAHHAETGSTTYPSPFLHHTQRHVPKETHVADVDVDPISGRKMINHYEIIDELGRGTHGKVKLGRDINEDHVYVAIKIVERFSKRRKLGRLGTTEDKVKKEVAILKKARHPNVVALLEVIDDPTRKKVYIVLEWVEKGEINWRRKAPKEIAMVEARRYERESREAKTGKHDEYLAAQDRAVLEEAKKRLDKQKRRQLRTFRRMRRGAHDAPEAWSNEMAGDDDMSDESEEDRLSRISSITGEMSVPLAQHSTQWLDSGAGRRISRTPSPLMPTLDTTNARPSRFLRLTAEPETVSPTSEPLSLSRNVDFNLTGLEGTMYGAYDPHSDPSSREASLPSSLRGSQHGSVEGLADLAHEVLDSHLDTELEYVPIMSMDQVRHAFRDTVLGLQYLHYQGIIHRDIKPPNLLASVDNRVKISDFGVSYLGRPVHNGEGEDVSEAEATDLDDEAKELAKTVGTPAFYAPELCSTDPTEDPLPVTKAIDIWALGITLFCMLFARTPFVDSEYVVMRSIAEEEVYIPAQRLQPVDTRPKSRPSSHGRGYSPQWARKRDEREFVYEELGEDLIDLLHKLLIKDPRKRITLDEVRQHPWVLADIHNKPRWIEESDPGLQLEHGKIEISNEEMKTAVVPLNLLDRAKSALKSATDRVINIATGGTRARGQSNAGSPAPSAHPSSSTISQDGRRHSLRGHEELFTALKASQHGEHPLSKSVAASPEHEKFEKLVPRLNGSSDSSNRLTRTTSRPSPPHRAMTVASAAGSMRTVTQSDYRKSITEESPPPSPGLPGTPMALASPGGSHLGGLLGGTARIIERVRAKSRQRSLNRRGLSSDRGSDRGSVQSSDPHGDPSVAVSGATAAGLVQQPESLRGEFTPQSSTHNSPSSSRAHSVTSDHQHLQPGAGMISRLSSSSSIASAGRFDSHRNASKPSSHNRQANESTAEDWQRAHEEHVRKRINEHKQQQQTEAPNFMSPEIWSSPKPFDGRPCPPSPDDQHGQRQGLEEPTLTDFSTPLTPDEEMSPSAVGQLPQALISSSSDLGSAVSMSISNPSIPSAISEASSIELGDPDDDPDRKTSSDDTLNPEARYSHSDDPYDEGYTPDEEAAVNSEEEYDSSSDSDNGLVMTRRKSAAKALPASHHRRGTGLSSRSKKSSRSGSNNTMKKVRTRESSDEQTRRSLDIREE
ncbi:Putative protein kinase [Septoria linicola]|uniref:non-specific serine/threonine protein kinase n=1 Tax=Septoria linicola TaxID=215465 RepID=A0A9Q9B7Q2_9PEZI|nr:putative protein kinase [Septoria linicola]USW58611.1 Putative protein kinase [Septoria linicola]